MTTDLPALRAKARAAFPAGHPVRTVLESLPDTLTPAEFAAIGASILVLAANPQLERGENNARNFAIH